MNLTNYKRSGIDLEDGLEVVVTGHPQIFERNGNLNFQTQTVEFVGEGALRKAYEELKKKIAKEGLFADERKRAVADYPTNICVITSREGAVDDLKIEEGKSLGF